MLIDALPLLESKDPKIFSKETIAILQHLEMELVPLIDRNKLSTAKFENVSRNMFYHLTIYLIYFPFAAIAENVLQRLSRREYRRNFGSYAFSLRSEFGKGSDH